MTQNQNENDNDLESQSMIIWSICVKVNNTAIKEDEGQPDTNLNIMHRYIDTYKEIFLFN